MDPVCPRALLGSRVIVEINWAPILAILIVGYGIAMWIAWSIVRDLGKGIDAIQKPLDRYAAMKRKDRS